MLIADRRHRKGNGPLGRQAGHELAHDFLNPVALGRIDTHEAESAFQDELHDLLRLAHDLSVKTTGEKRIQGLPAHLRPAQVVPRHVVRRHNVTTSPGFQSGLRSQYS